MITIKDLVGASVRPYFKIDISKSGFTITEDDLKKLALSLSITEKENVTIAIYRTAADGSIYYRIDTLDASYPLHNSFSSDTYTFTDSFADVDDIDEYMIKRNNNTNEIGNIHIILLKMIDFMKIFKFIKGLFGFNDEQPVQAVVVEDVKTKVLEPLKTVVEAPKVEAPKVEAPKVEAPKVEVPKVEKKEEPKKTAKEIKAKIKKPVEAVADVSTEQKPKPKRKRPNRSKKPKQQGE
jgi:hypothetical protein